MNTNNEKRLKANAYQILKERLVDCVYPPGSMLNEAQLATELQLSRTPIREAISKLEMEGFVQILPKKGIYVTNITLNEVVQVFQTRLEIEPVALRLAAPHLPKEELQAFCEKFRNPSRDIPNSFRLDTAMHLFIVEHCGNRYIIDMMHRVFEENTRIIISSKQNQAHIHDAKQEHLDILTLLIQDEFEKAEAAMRSHVEECRQAALDYFLNNQIYSVAADAVYKKELNKLQD
jgi:DNA-binding GntR family transcriptional regulator